MVNGSLFDTDRGYPAAVFTLPAANQMIRGRMYRLVRVAEALALLDEVESAVDGLYSRVVVRTSSGEAAWAYECGDPALLVRPIPGGDWLHRH
jgi:gamma-glutamylcyclotransferase (GGCT)/AIG2-like uncharacterized protein YtfP